MAPVKRRRPGEENDDEIVAVDYTSSGLRKDRQRKKNRLSDPSIFSKEQNDREGRSHSPSDAGQTPGPDTNIQDNFRSTQYDIDRDAGFAHLENPERDDELATQRLVARGQLIGENHAAENGIIESVTMINFMCNDRTHVPLGPLINFIIGENGSGKSTVLTAITLCLGGKASTTNRGGSLKSFIKEGCDQASLIIRLKNQGVDAYQPDIFGETIIVERHFSKTGTSGFKLKDATGHVISTKKSEVEEIQEYFQMQIENPMSVLTQDAARQFLNTSTPMEKYKCFVKGVQLEQLDNDYRLVSLTADSMSDRLDATKEQVKNLQKIADQAKEKAKIVNQHKGMRDRIRLFGKQSAWAQVEEQERSLQERELIVEDSREKIRQIEIQIEEKDRTYRLANERAEAAEERKKCLVDELVPLMDEESEAKVAFEAANQEVANTHLEQRQIKTYLTAALAKVEGIQKNINEEHERLESASDGSHARRLAELTTAQEQKLQTEKLLEENMVMLPRLEEQCQLALEEYEGTSVPVGNKQREIQTCAQRIESLNRDASSALNGFDQKMPRLLNMIRDDSGFREKPVGPMGLHIKLLKPIWSHVLEKSIGNLLSGFVVTCKVDQQRLSGMMRQLGLENSPVVIGNHHLIDIRGHEPDEQYDTVLRVLEIDNELIKRQLIINQGIEQTILIERRSDAMRAMYDGERPRNVKQCFCLHDTRRGWGIRLGYMPNSTDPSSGPIQAPYGKPRMKTDSESQIAYQKESLNQLHSELKTLEGRRRELQQVFQKHTQVIVRHKRAQTELKVQDQRGAEEIERLQQDLDQNQVEDGRLQGLKDYLKEATQEVDLHGGSYGEAALAKKKQNVICKEFQAVLLEVRTRIEEQEFKIKKGEEQLKRIQLARQIALQDKNSAIEMVELLRIGKEGAEQKRDRQSARVIEFITEASKICERVAIPNGETAHSLDKKITKITEAVNTYNRKLGGSDDEILIACEQAQSAYRASERQLEDLTQLLQVIKMSIMKRQEMWRRFQQHISAQSRINFTYLLSERGFRGKLRLDHKNKLLELEVEPDETKKSSRGRATKTLSGGEKSFSSICLLLSLWEAMGAPLRCLDEFDVFMDPVNRDVSTNMIIGAARRSVSKQFILITPLAIGGDGQFDKDVKVTRLWDPRKKQIDQLLAA